jgi:hypothetical protein
VSFSEGIEELKENEIVVNLLISSSFRNISLQSMRLFVPIYYAAAFPEKLTQFSESDNALSLCFLGGVASIGGGILSD